jgi:hypothetical protein
MHSSLSFVPKFWSIGSQFRRSTSRKRKSSGRCVLAPNITGLHHFEKDREESAENIIGMVK